MDCLVGESAGCLQAAPVVRRAPRRRVNVDEVGPVAERLALNPIVHHAVQQLDAADRRLKGNPNAAFAVVRLHGDLAGASRPVAVQTFWFLLLKIIV